MGKDYCLVRTATNEVYAWGRNKDGQLGLGHTRDVTVPTQIKFPNIQEDGADVQLVSIGAHGRTSMA